MQALERANHIRLKRAALRRDITAGRTSPIEFLEGEIPPEMQNMTLGYFLGAIKHWGPKKVSRFLGAFAFSEKRTIGSLTERQRRLIALELRRVAAKRNKMSA